MPEFECKGETTVHVTTCVSLSDEEIEGLNREEIKAMALAAADNQLSMLTEYANGMVGVGGTDSSISPEWGIEWKEAEQV